MPAPRTRRSAAATVAAATVALTAACSHQVQTTSGADYLAGWTPPTAVASAMQTTDDASAQASRTAGATTVPATGDAMARALRAAAAVEPTLRLPARIGLARVARGHIVAIPAAEAEALEPLAASFAQLGTVVPVEPLVVRYTVSEVGLQEGHCQGNDRYRAYHRPCLANAINAIRLGAARQHLDAVVVYEAGASSTTDATLLAVADITLIGGAILPTREVEARGTAAAIMIDVRTGYPYGSAQARADASAFATTFGQGRVVTSARADAALAAVEALVPELEAMLDGVARAMRERTRTP